MGSTAKGTVLGGGAGEEIEDGSMRREKDIFDLFHPSIHRYRLIQIRENGDKEKRWNIERS